MDYLHGSSYIFGNIRSLQNGNNLCYFCNAVDDSPEHQLIDCREVQDQTHQQLIASWNKEEQDQLIVDILVPDNDTTQIQKMFVKRINFLLEQHDSIEELHPELG